MVMLYMLAEVTVFTVHWLFYFCLMFFTYFYTLLLFYFHIFRAR